MQHSDKSLQLWLQPFTGNGRSAQSRAARQLLQRALEARGLALPESELGAGWARLEEELLQCWNLYPGISHCPGLVAVALGQVPFGLDCESPGRARDWLALARHAFSEAEATSLAGLPAAERAAAFLALWTLKEAAIKATGGSVFGDLNRLRQMGETYSLQEAGQWWAWRGTCNGTAVALVAAGEILPPRVFLWDGTAALPLDSVADLSGAVFPLRGP
ncbi:4'-phosphopantetheinyl transferase family protein [Parahaliea aestuarii]|uniref:4'-phosphopantetheinyl transferase family protein n=1 Tax=Parahaliea aestuarii TaxID=1852021 RepID=UPI001C9C98AA|nr:4'-phosphopantetheinyl transferase superfamily protein [Parahaliea aestuarii]